MRRVSAGQPVSPGEAHALFARLAAAPQSGPVVIGVSGGPDSMALMGLYAQTAQRIPLPQALIVTVDHGLRAESAQEAGAVAATAARLGLNHTTLAWRGRKPKSGIQEAARNARYRLLADYARQSGTSTVLVAHTLDDQAETVLMRLTGGSGIRGLGAMDTFGLVSGAVIHRPLLGIAKARLVATCIAHGWNYAVDPANSNTGFLRARLRALAPELAREGLTPERLARLAERMRRADEALDAHTLRVIEACRIWKRGQTLYDATRLCDEPDEIVVRFFAHVIALGRDAELDFGHLRLERIETLAGAFLNAARAGLPFRRNVGGVLFCLRAGQLRLASEPARRGKKLTKSEEYASAELGKADRAT